MSFLTVEDFNSTLLNYGNINEFFVLDSAKIPFDESNQMFFYDFVNIWKEDEYYYLNVDNSLWTGGYYITDRDDKFLANAEMEYIRGRFCYAVFDRYDSLPEGFKIYFYMTNYHDKFELRRLVYYVENLKNFNIRQSELFSFKFKISSFDGDLTNFEGRTIYYQIGSNSYSAKVDKNNYVNFYIRDKLTESCNCSISVGNSVYYFFINVFKDNLIFDLDADLLVGAVNKVKIVGLESQDLTYATGSVNIDGKESKLFFGNGEFIVDLTNESVARDILIKITVNEDDEYYGFTHEFKLKSHYFRPNSFAELKKELERIDGAPIIELNSSLKLEGNINVNHDVVIKNTGDNFVIVNCFGNSIIINENILFKVNNINFMRGNPAFIQKKGSSVEFNNVEFRFCENTDANNVGCVVYCDIDTESLNDENDFITTFNNSTFRDNHSCILHGGLLTVDNCKFRVINNICFDFYNPSFVYQVDGECTITNSIFDVDFNDMILDSSQVGFSQALVMCGVTATINGAGYKNLQSDNSLPFFESPYNNKSHLFIEYYYPEIESEVFISPISNFEDKSCCHAVSGVDWIFKDNVQITRKDWGSENTKRIITW